MKKVNLMAEDHIDYFTQIMLTACGYDNLTSAQLLKNVLDSRIKKWQKSEKEAEETRKSVMAKEMAS